MRNSALKSLCLSNSLWSQGGNQKKRLSIALPVSRSNWSILSSSFPSGPALTHYSSARQQLREWLYFQTLSILLFPGGEVGNWVIKKLKVINGPFWGVRGETFSHRPLCYTFGLKVSLSERCAWRDKYQQRTQADFIKLRFQGKKKTKISKSKLYFSFQRRKTKRDKHS